MSDSNPKPDLLKRVISFSGYSADSGVMRAEFTQAGHMWREPGGKPLAFEADEWMEGSSLAFGWTARFRVAPLVSLVVLDQYAGDGGVLEGRLWGRLKLFSSQGPEVDVGEVYRYLSELAWVPAAYIHNKLLSWREVNSDTLEVSTSVSGRQARLELTVDSDGRVTGVRAEDRPREVDGEYVDSVWIGQFDDWKRVNGHMIPTRAEVAWELPEGKFTYWKGGVLDHRMV